MTPSPDDEAVGADTFAVVEFPRLPAERIDAGRYRVFGRTDLDPPTDESVGRACGEIRVLRVGALIVCSPGSNTPLWLRTSRGQRIEITEQHPVLIPDEGHVYVGTGPADQAGYRFHVSVSLFDDDPHAGFTEQRPSHRSTDRLDRVPTTQPGPRLTELRRLAVAALTVDYGDADRSGPARIRSPHAAALVKREPPITAAQIGQATRDLADLVEREGWVQLIQGHGRRQELCDWLVRIGAIGPADWNEVRQWLR